MQAPSRDSGDFSLAGQTETTLFMPEITKSTRASERVPHVICFAFLEVGFIGRIVGVRVVLNLDMSLDGSAVDRATNWQTLFLIPPVLLVVLQ